MHMPRFKQCTS